MRPRQYFDRRVQNQLTVRTAVAYEGSQQVSYPNGKGAEYRYNCRIQGLGLVTGALSLIGELPFQDGWCTVQVQQVEGRWQITAVL